ncbi:MAG: HEAT repeat domain-containing protein [Lentisphaeria bacterium]|nr:HEAT repeat domain-containing protein [Lentisphaeria bacterium]
MNCTFPRSGSTAAPAVLLAVTMAVSAALTPRLQAAEDAADPAAAGPRAVLSVLQDVGSPDMEVRKRAQESLQQRCWQAGRPGAEAERLAMCRGLGEALSSPDANETARLFLVGQLQWIGRQAAVPALAAALGDKAFPVREQARRALAANPTPEAGQALVRELSAAADPAWRGALLQAIGYHGDGSHAQTVSRFLGDADGAVRLAAVQSLARIGDAAALAPLANAGGREPEALGRATREARLCIAERLCADGRSREALDVYRDLLGGSRHEKCAAILGIGRAGGADELPALFGFLEDADAEIQGAARMALSSMPARVVVPAVTRRIASALPGLKAELLSVLAEAHYAEAFPVFAAAAADEDESVRLAAIDGMGRLGDERAAPELVRLIPAGTPAVRDAARNALALLPGDAAVVRAVAEALKTAAEDARTDLVHTLTVRRSPAAVDTLVQTARNDAAKTVRTAALDGLGALAAPEHGSALVDLLLAAPSDAERETAQKAIVAVSRRTASVELLSEPILAAIRTAGKPARALLLRALGRLGGERAAQAVRTAAADPDAEIRLAAIRAFGDWPDMSVADDLRALIRDETEILPKVLALRGYTRLVREVCGAPAEEKVALYRGILSADLRAEEKKLVLAGLGEVPHPGAMELAGSFLPDAALAAEAAVAVNQVADAIRWTLPDAARQGLQAVLGAEAGEAAKARAGELLGQIDTYDGYIERWFLAGPYTQKGKAGKDLLPIPFPPETEPAKDPGWRVVATGSEPGKTWYVPLDVILGGSQCVAYLRTLAWVPDSTRARLEVGSDDGVKAWVNGTEALVNDADRAVAPAQDTAAVALTAGWNAILLKVSQTGGNWSGAARLRAADGSPLPEAVAPGDPRLFEVARRSVAGGDRQAEAALEALRLAGGLPAQEKPILEAVIAQAAAPDLRERVRQRLTDLEAAEDFIPAWETCGPFLVAGKEGAELLDLPFDPETKPDFDGWRPAPPGPNPQRPWELDFGKIYGGDHRAAYVRSLIHAEQACEAQLEIGSDDGIKAWLNGEVAHSNNAARPVRPGDDKAKIRLRQGANTLLLKITQGQGGWGVCARVRAADGSHLDGIRHGLPEK